MIFLVIFMNIFRLNSDKFKIRDFAGTDNDGNRFSTVTKNQKWKGWSESPNGMRSQGETSWIPGSFWMECHFALVCLGDVAVSHFPIERIIVRNGMSRLPYSYSFLPESRSKSNHVLQPDEFKGRHILAIKLLMSCKGAQAQICMVWILFNFFQDIISKTKPSTTL